MKAITICVEFDDLLKLTLPYNIVHFDRYLIVTSPKDKRTIGLAMAYGLEINQTDAFSRNGAYFNKGLAMEEGFDVLGRDGWICVIDADTVLPACASFNELEPGNLYTPQRRMCLKPSSWDKGWDWNEFPLCSDGEWAGYCQIFHGSDPVLQCRPWYGIDWIHAGGCDSDFQFKWPQERKLRLSWEVLHLGPDGANWCGRVTHRLDGTIPEGAQERREFMKRLEEVRLTRGIGTEMEKISRALL